MSSVLHATALDSVGYSQLKAELSAATPTGSGIGISQTEALDTSGNYAPNPAFSEFANITFTLKSPPAAGFSGHATNIVGQYLYGSVTSSTPGITQVHVWETNDWLTNFLKMGISTSAPASETQKIQNHSWVADYGSPANNAQAIGRFDYMIDQSKVLSVVGVNNDNTEPGGGSDQTLLSASYHAVRVGCTDGGHMFGSITLEENNRQRIDVVAPSSRTSRAAALVSSTAALLYQTVAGSPALAPADDPRVIKAILMSGATKLPSMNWENSPTAPLDDRYGAGQINVYQNHRILTAGQQPASDSADAGTTGWDFRSASTSSTRRYFFNVATGADFSATLVWHRVIGQNTVPNGRWNNPTSTLSNLNLRLCHASGYTTGDTVASSTSSVESHEHLWVTDLAPGRYVIEVSSLSGSASYGLAYQTLPIPVPANPTGFSAASAANSSILLQWTDASADETGFRIERSLHPSSGFAPIATPAANSTSHVDTGLTAGTTYYYRLYATNLGGDSGPASAQAVSYSLLEEWRIENFGSPANNGDGANSNDYDGDGLDNLFEYGVGSDPKSAAHGPALRLVDNPLKLEVEFDRINDPSLTYSLWASGDLLDWGEAAIWFSTGTENVNGPVTIPDVEDITANSKRFLQLRITRP